MATGVDDRLVTDPAPARRPRRQRTDYAKQYWWVPAVAVPILVALIAIVPDIVGGSAPAGTTTVTTTVGDLYFVTNVQMEDPAARAQFDSAVALAGAGQFAQAKTILEQLASTSQSAAVYNNLAVVNAALKDDAAAQKSVEQALQLDPGSEAVRENLTRLAEGRRNPAPGTTLRTPAEIRLGTATEATLVSDKDQHFYTFTTPEGARDIIEIAVANRSTTLSPYLELYDPRRNAFQQQATSTPGADVLAEFVALPATTYFVGVRPHYSGTTGAYALTVTARRAFDRYEPNEDIQSPRRIAAGADVQAGIMDKGDVDLFEIPVRPGRVRAVLSNRSATLSPAVELLDSRKAAVLEQVNTTPGGDVTTEATADQAGTWYVKVRAHYSGGGGDYSLRIEQ